MFLPKIRKMLSGFLALRPQPSSNSGKLRKQIEELLSRHLAEKEQLPSETDDLEVIEQGVHRIVQALHARLSAAEQAKNAMEQQLIDADRLKGLGLIAGGIAHDFGNTMCVVTGSTQMAQLTLQNPGQTAEFLKTISEAAQHGVELTQQMMALASGQQTGYSACNISTAISQISGVLRGSVGSANTVQYKIEDNVMVDEANITQIRQVVLNLVSNGADAMSNPGTITISTCKRAFTKEELQGMSPPEHIVPGKYACIEVSDTGCGMEEKTRQHMFDDFYTTKMVGRGLGLSVVKSIVRNHDGLVGVVASAPDKGSTFRILIPSNATVHRAARGISK